MCNLSNLKSCTSLPSRMIIGILYTIQLTVLHFATLQIGSPSAIVASATPRVQTTAPLNPIEIGGVLGVHCQVWNLDSGHEVTIIRRIGDGQVQRLSSGDGLTHSTEDRVFLAPRQLEDGSVVYFLSIMSVTRQDEGEYSCRIVNIAEGNIVTADSITLHVTYFPSDSDPACTPTDQPLTLREGTRIMFNCTSEAAFPQVSLSWTRVGTKEKYHTKNGLADNGRLFSTLMLTASRQHNEAVFLCHIHSAAFPGKTRTCHVGPITVIPNGSSKPDGNGNMQKPSSGGNDYTNNHPVVTRLPPGIDGDARTIETQEVSIMNHVKCAELCSQLSSTTDVTFWIVATIVGAIFALTFFIMGVCLFVKYYRLPQTIDTSRYVAVQPPCHDIYAELDGRGRSAEGKVYMTLEQADKSSNRLIEIQHERAPHSHYDVMPNLPKL